MIHEADACIDIRIWKEFQEMRDDEFSSSEIDEPVGDDGDAVIFWKHKGLFFLAYVTIYPLSENDWFPFSF